ncbi:MAG: O-antigen ligase family protein, partial [Acetatifactor sp.]|nr:O-antigen ligase family protein [Acetatifactor sp.]
SRLWQRKDWMIGLWVPALAVIALLGYLNRFGINPLEMKSAGPQYISTIGNINWYCGYVVTVLSGIAYYLWQGYGALGKKWLHIAGVFVLGIGMASLITQGSSSGIVALLILLGVFYLLSMRDAGKLQRFWSGCILLSGVCLFTWGLRRIWPQAITYCESTTDLLTLSPLPFFMMGGSLLGWFLVYWSRRTGRFRARIWSLLGIAAWSAAGAAVIIFVILLVVNTRRPGSIGALSEFGAFTFDACWGSNRGITWTAGLACFLDQGLAGRLVGVGPDAMALYIHSGANPALKQMVEEYFGRLMLTNAHNEWLTVLINEGVLGALGYIGLTVTAICRYLKAGREDVLAGAAGIGILAYAANNIFSFQQVMSTSAVFLILGVGEACLRSRGTGRGKL